MFSDFEESCRTNRCTESLACLSTNFFFPEIPLKCTINWKKLQETKLSVMPVTLTLFGFQNLICLPAG